MIPSSMRRWAAGRSGHALLVTMMAAACLAPLGAFAAMQARLDFLVQHHTRATLETFVVAESGLEHALADLALDPSFDRLLRGPDRQAGTADDGDYPFAHPPPDYFPAPPFRYAVRVTARGADAVELTASGVGPLNAAHSVAAIVVRDTSPYIPGALVVAAPDAVLALGSDFRVAGSAPSGADPGLPAVAVSGAGAAAALAAQLPAGAGAQLTGRGGAPSIADASLPSVENLAAAAATHAGVQSLPSEVQGDIGDGLFVSPGSIDLVDASGSGILVTRGVLHLSGTSAFAGIVVALGGVQIDAGGSAAIDGAVLVGTAGAVVALRESGRIAYDPRVVARVDQEFPGLLPRRARVTGWHDYADVSS